MHIILILVFIFILFLFVIAFSDTKIVSESHNMKVDLVYLWVDGSDEKWINLRNKYMDHAIQKKYNDENRYIQNDELKYSLRSVKKYAGDIINKIYIVVLGDKPIWLVENDQLKVIDQRSIIPEEYSPTFNSMSIEICLHRIPGLTDYFLIANDDFFFANKCYISTFLTKDLKIKMSMQSLPAPSFLPHSKLCHHSNEFLNQIKFEKYRTQKAHTIMMVHKSYYEDLWNNYPNEVKKTLSFKFRNENQITVVSFVFPYIGFYRGDAVKVYCMGYYIELNSINDIEILKKAFNNSRKFACINYISNNPEVVYLYHKTMNEIFPEKSDWEI